LYLPVFGSIYIYFLPSQLLCVLNFFCIIVQSTTIEESLQVDSFFVVVKDNIHYVGGSDKGISFWQDEAAWLPYSFIGYINKNGTRLIMFIVNLLQPAVF